MTTRPLQPAGLWQALSPAHQDMRRTVSRDLADVLLRLRSDPRLTTWEMSFVTTLEKLIRDTHYQARLSQAQWDTTWLLSDKLDQATRETQGLLEGIRNLRGDPLLTAWEEGFLASLDTALRLGGHWGLLSPKQRMALERIEAALPARRTALAALSDPDGLEAAD